jgi:hypothetical protein
MGGLNKAVDVSGGLVHKHAVYRDPLMAQLSQVELEQLEVITRKLALPSPEACKIK